MNVTVNERTNAFEINFQELFGIYIRKWWQIVICAILAASISLGYTYYFVTPMYQADISIYVNNNRSTEDMEYLSNADVYAAQRLVNTYVNIVKSDRVLDKVAQRLGGEYTADSLYSVITAEPLESTGIFYVYAIDDDPKEAARIANAVAEVAPVEISELIDATSARVIDTAKVPKSCYSPNYINATFLGGIVGALLCIASITIVFITDTRIKDENDLTFISDLPILGRIPNFERVEIGSSSYGYHSNEENKKEVSK